METAQDPNHLGGKFLRLNDDGSIPSDNPFVGKAGHRPEIFALGSRNAQGIDWHPATGAMFATEHGPSREEIRQPTGGADEFNLVTPGCNLGWPLIHAHHAQERLVTPLINFVHTIAPGSGMVYTGTATPAMTDSCFIGCMRAHALARVELGAGKPSEVHVKDWSTVLDDLGRIRALTQGPLDFAQPASASNTVLYFASSNGDRYGGHRPNGDRIFRIVPK